MVVTGLDGKSSNECVALKGAWQGLWSNQESNKERKESVPQE